MERTKGLRVRCASRALTAAHSNRRAHRGTQNRLGCPLGFSAFSVVRFLSVYGDSEDSASSSDDWDGGEVVGSGSILDAGHRAVPSL